MKISMRLFKRKSNGIWYVESNGKRVSLKTRDSRSARKAYKKLEREYLRGKVAWLVGECTKTLKQFRTEFLEWAEAVQPKSTFRANRLALDKLIDQCGEHCKLDQVSHKHIDQMIAEHLSCGIKRSSVNNYIRHSKAVLSKAVDWDYIKSNPLRNVKQLSVPKKQPKFIEKSAIPKFLNSIDDIELRKLLTASIVTGRRRKELLGLEWRDIDFDNKRYVVRHSKIHLEKIYPINSMFLTVLKSIGQGKPNEKIFKLWHKDTVSKKTTAALRKAGIANLTLHNLRDTFASLKAEDGATIFEIKELLGHSDIRCTLIYAHLTDNYLAEVNEVNIGPVDFGDAKKK